MGTPSQSYRTSRAIWDHTVLRSGSTRQKVNAPCQPQPCRLVFDLPPRRDERLSWLSWLDSSLAGSRTSDLSITSPTPNCCTTKTTCPNFSYVHCSYLCLSNWQWHSDLGLSLCVILVICNFYAVDTSAAIAPASYETLQMSTAVSL